MIPLEKELNRTSESLFRLGDIPPKRRGEFFMAQYKAAAYLRLSYVTVRGETPGQARESGYQESDSIGNQRKLIEDFAANQPDIELVSEQVDDGYSGILFDRPAFLAMMDDVKAGKINCIIVKDISRLGREHVETSRYLCRILPAYGVRFIAINDHIDTAHQQNGDDLLIAVKTMTNDSVCRNSSVSTRSALQAKRKSGAYVGACPIYGYQKDPEDRNHLVIDEYASLVVQDIYRRRIEGASACKIAEELNRQGVLSPLAYKVSRGLPHPAKGFADSPDSKWSPTAIIRILQDETYTGTLIQGKTTTPNYKLKNVVRKPVKEWTRVENTHQPIVSKRDFDLVQQLAQLDTRAAPEKDSVYMFSGLLICGCCGGRMTRKTNIYKGQRYIYYHCPTGKAHGCQHPARIREDDLVQCVLSCLQAHIKSVVSLKELLNSISREQINHDLVEKYTTEIADNNRQLEEASRMKATLYGNLVKGILDKKEYRSLMDYYSAQEEQAQDAIALLREKLEQAQDDSSSRLKWARHFEEFASMTELDRRAVVTLIQSITVRNKKEIEVSFRFQEEYEDTLKLLSRYKEAS